MFRSIKKKLVFVFCGISIFFAVMAAVISYSLLTNHLKSMQQRNQDALAKALCSSVEYFRDECETAINAFQENEDFLGFVLEWKNQGNVLNLHGCLNEIKGEETFIKNIFLIDYSYDYTGTENPSDIRSYMIDRISTAERYGESCVWDSGYSVDSLMLFRCIKVPGIEKHIYLFFQISNSRFLDMFDRFRAQNDQRFSLKGKWNGFEVTEQGFFYHYYEDYNKLVHSNMDFGDWTLRTWSGNTITKIVSKEFISRIIVIIIILFILTFLLSMLISREISKPIQNMRETAKKYANGEFDARVQVRGKDEIAELGNVLNDMASQIMELFSDVKEQERQKKYLGLQTLNYQINPHFLYNTLDSINMLARKNDDIQVALMVTNLSRLFRLSLNNGRETASVRDEIEHVSYYLKIQKFRFEEQLDWNVEVERDILDYRILHFLLQPLVENAIYHGIKSKNENGCVTIRGRREDSNLLFTVEDNGKGMNEAELSALKQKLEEKTMNEKETRGFGVWNVNQRIKLFYGNEYGIEIESEELKGTIVRICIPCDLE